MVGLPIPDPYREIIHSRPQNLKALYTDNNRPRHLMDPDDKQHGDRLVGVFGDRSGPRSRNGCLTCRRRKVKCDETRPVCAHCSRLSKVCDWNLGRGGNRIQNRTQLEASHHPRQDITSDYTRQCLGEAHTREALYTHSSSSSNEDGIIVETSNSSLWQTSTATEPNHGLTSIPSIGLSLTPSGTSSSGLHLDQDDHEAIHYYGSLFTAALDTKNHLYSLPSIIFKIGASSVAVINMVLAIGRQQIGLLPNCSPSKVKQGRIKGMYHYWNAIQAFCQEMKEGLNSSRLDEVLATIWLIIQYEYRFGDGKGHAISQHLEGVAAILKIHVRLISCKARNSEPENMSNLVLVHGAQEISYIGLRLIVWLTGIDARAASYGLDGRLNKTLANLFGLGYHKEREVSWSSFHSALYERSSPLFRSFWGADYPSSEIEFDAENQPVFQLFRECTQIRLTLAEAKTATLENKTVLLERALKEITVLRLQYANIFSIASGPSQGLTTSICWVMPHYYANVLDYCYESEGPEPETNSQKAEAFQMIMKLAYHGHRMEGDSAICRVAGVLYKVGLKTEDPIHRQWILDHLQPLSMFSKAFKLAFDTLQAVVTREQTEAEGQDARFFI